MIARLFNARSQAGANLVPYANVGVGTQDLIGGHVDAMAADLASTAALARQGRLRDRDVADRIGLIGPIVDASMNAEAVADFLRRGAARWQGAVKAIGVLPE